MTIERTLIKRIERTLPDAFVGGHLMDIKVVFSVFRVSHKFVVFKPWTTYQVDRNVPYIEDPLYDGEYNTNRQLQVIEKMIEEEVRAVIREDEDRITEERKRK